MATLEIKSLFNPSGTRDLRAQRLIGGPSVNLLEFAHCKYSWAEQLYRKMRSFFWIPDEIPSAEDKQQFPTLTVAEQEAYKKTLAFLIFLDSIQVDNLGVLAQYITAPEVTACIKTQAFFETIHAQSYDYLLTSVVDSLTREAVYDLWRNDPRLLSRIRFITDQYEAFIWEPSPEHLIKSVVANFLLEGIYFYSGFAFFYALGRQDKMGSTVSLIRLIQRDENTHLALFTHIIRGLREENPQWFTPDIMESIAEMINTAVEHEIGWGQYITHNQILGLSDTLIDHYIRYLGNLRAYAIGLPPLYPEATQHPMAWVDDFAAMNSTKTDFFERPVTNYRKAGGSLHFDRLKPPGV